MDKYHYTECGLDNVFINGLEPMTDADGDEVVQIPAINLLHAKIAEGIISHHGSMNGKELRFLRTEMGLTQAQLASLVHCDKQTVGRWERQETPVDGSAETVIRMLAAEKLLENFVRSVEDLAKSSIETAENQMININAKDDGSYDLAA